MTTTKSLLSIFFLVTFIFGHRLFSQVPLNYDVLEIDQVFAEFGVSTSNAGDVNGDGYDDLLVGSNYYDNGQTNEGGVFVYYGTSTGINPVAATILESNQASSDFGFSVSTAGDVNGDGYSDIIIGADDYDNGQTNEGRVYIYHGSITGINPSPATILEIDQSSARFGFSVSNAGDVNNDGYDDIIAGALYYDNGQTDEGRTYIYHGSASGVDSTPETILESNQASAKFGLSVSNAGDLNQDGYDDIIVGSPYYENDESGEGRVFIYHGSATGISDLPAVSLESNDIYLYFGYSVSDAGDVNGDNYDDIIVGAYNYSSGQTQEGATYLYFGSETGVVNVVIDTIESNQASAWLGISVSNVNDINNDGFDDIVAGADHYDNGQTNEGAAFIYLGSADGLVASPLVPLEGNQASAYFGVSVSGGGDINGDGYADVIIGANGFDNGESNEGRTFIYYGAGCISQYYLDNDGDGYGNASTSLYSCDAPAGYIIDSSDCNDDNELIHPETVWYKDGDLDSYYTETPITQCVSPGIGYVISGITAGGDCVDSSNISYPGAIEIIDGLDNNCDGFTDENFDWIYGGLFGYWGGPGNSLGYCVSEAGDVNGDGYHDVIVGANVGRAYIFYGTSSGLSFTNADTVSYEYAVHFGYAVSAAGDVNGDGFDDVIVGAELYDNGQTDEGGAFIYHGSASGINVTPAVILESNLAAAKFGYSAACAGDVNGDGYDDVVIGAYGYTNVEGVEGAAYIYHGSPTGISITPTAILENNLAYDHFGNAVAGAGDYNGDGFDDLVIGAESGGVGDEGLVYFYKGSSTGIVTIPDASVESNAGSSLFGHSVSTAGDVNNDGYDDVIVGAYKFQFGLFGEGRIYIFLGTAAGINTTPVAIREGNQGYSYLGCSVSDAGDINNDGFHDVIAGAYNHSDFETYEGKAFIYLGNESGISTDPDYTFECNQAYADFGYSVSGVGDLNGDGLDDVIVGARNYNHNTSNDGAVFVYLNDACLDTFYVDVDGDGYGNSDVFTTSCSLPAGYTVNHSDCNDANAAINPDTPELCNTLDDNCNGLIDDGIVESISISAGGPTTFCQGGSVLLTATYSGTDVQWKKDGVNIPGATSSTYNVTKKATYTATTTSDCGTATSDGIFVNVQKNPPASITAGGPTTFCAGGSVVLTANAGPGLSYQWYKGATPIAGATSINYTATLAGNYKCRVTKTATGCFKNSNVITVSVPCKEEDQLPLVEPGGSITIFPNPATDQLNINVNPFTPDSYRDHQSLPITIGITITDITGKTVAVFEIASSTMEVNISTYAAGLYFINLNIDGKEFTEKFIKE